jgi:hypothetical protein
VGVRALLACLVVALAALALTVEPARACSCVPPDPWKILKQADGAFVGRLVSRREADQGRAVLTFSVERAVKGSIGDTVEVTTANNSAACGIETPVGQRVGLFLDRQGNRWLGHLCWQVSPEDLLAAAALPAPNGRGPAALLVGGRFGSARTLALDAKGRTLAYGLGAGNVLQHSPCPGGSRVAELVQRGSAHVIAIRELPSLWLVREQRLPKREYGVASLRCVDGHGERLALFSSGPDARGLLARISPRSVAMMWRGAAFYASYSRQRAYVQVLARGGTRIVAVDLRTGASRSLGAVREDGLHALTPNVAGTRLAGDSYKEGIGNPRLVVIDLARRPIAARSIPLPTDPVGSTHWITGDTLAWIGGDAIRVYSSRLRLIGRVSGWAAGHTELIGRVAYGVTADGALLSAKLPTGGVRVVRRLPGRPSSLVSAAR